MEQVVDVGGNGGKLRVEEGWLVWQGADWKTGTVPVGDVAVLMLSEPGISLSAAVLTELSVHGAVVAVCDRRHVPVGVFQPFSGHGRGTGILRMQAAARPLLKARLWRRIVEAKIRAQARALERCGLGDAALEKLSRRVKRGDSTNAEGCAACRYWRRLGLFPRRDRRLDDANRTLNYAYAVLHAATVRALCAAGLHPAFGLNHRNAANPHVLASDLMEPFRPAADLAVRGWLLGHPDRFGVDPPCRGHLLGILTGTRWRTTCGMRSLSGAVEMAARSLRTCLEEKHDRLELPVEEEAGENGHVDAGTV